MTQKFTSTQLHFRSIKQIKPGSLVCNVPQNEKGINIWKTNQNKEWDGIGYFFNKADFEKKMGELKTWQHVLLVNGDSLYQYYEDGDSYRDTAHIVEPTNQFYKCKTPKPTLFTTYYTKEPYADLVNRVPELEGIF
jgi:hypothetical protein